MGRLATRDGFERRESACPLGPTDVSRNGQMIQSRDCVFTDGLFFRMWTRGVRGASASTARRRERAPGMQARRWEIPAGSTIYEGSEVVL